MFFELNDEQKAFQKRVREIYEREVSPLVEEYERKEAFPVQLFPILGAEQKTNRRNGETAEEMTCFEVTI